MILILISWILLFLFASISGIAIKNWFDLSSNNTFTLLFGIIYQTFFLSICAFFYKINYEVFILNFIIQLLFFFKFKREFQTYFRTFFESFQFKHKLLFGILIFLTALKSAQVPTIFDNESYYIQTIKWVNEFGFVKGVANVHPFLGQFSFWHVLQSGFTFSFLHLNLNDINGFLLLIGIYYLISKQIKNEDNFSFVSSIFLIFYFQFIDSPSPDLPILVISAILFYEFLYNLNNQEHIKTYWLLTVYIIFIKITVLSLILIGLYFWVTQRKHTLFIVKTSFLFGIVWILKNTIVTGFPMFPSTFIDLDLDWEMNKITIKKVTHITIDAGYSENLVKTAMLSMQEKWQLWWNLKGINMLFNKGIIILFLCIPFTKTFKSKRFQFLYLFLLIHFVFLMLISPQYRFFLATFIFLATIVGLEIYNKYFRFINRNIVVLVALFLVTSTLFIDLKNKTFQFGLSPINVIIPNSNTKYTNAIFEKKQLGNFKYYQPHFSSPNETSDGNLPCVNNQLFKYYKYIPQQRTTEIKDGFYAKKYSEN